MSTGRDAEAAAHVAMQDVNIVQISSRVVGGCAAMVAPDDGALEMFDAALALPRIERRWVNCRTASAR